MVLPWLCAGDFNEILIDNEKQGGAPGLVKQVQDFQDVVMECGLSEMHFSGSGFTWTRENGEGVIAERLDKGFINDGFWDRFSHSFEQYFQAISSYHLLILFCISRRKIDTNLRKRLFRFENMWIRHTECEDIVKMG